jgi:hypothetical protein
LLLSELLSKAFSQFHLPYDFYQLAMSSSVDPASLLISAAVPAFKCPPGTKMYILDLGTLEIDESWFV